LPTPAPVKKPRDNGGPECFSGDDTVKLKNGDIIPLSDIRIGDEILTVDSNNKYKFSPVISLPHGKNSIHATFVHIVTAKGLSIKLTKEHFLPVTTGACRTKDAFSGDSWHLIKANSIVVDSCVMTWEGVDSVEEVNFVDQDGIYLAVTLEEFIIVNGIVASPYAVSHFWSHEYYSFHRFVWQFAPLIARSKWFLSIHGIEIGLYKLAPSVWNQITTALDSYTYFNDGKFRLLPN
jgi:hypothetical protein